MNLEKLSTLAKELPEDVRQNAIDLVERMGEVIEGIGDKPVTWRPGILKLVQAMSDRSKLPKGAGVGDFLLGEDKVEQPLDVVVLRTWQARQYWSPDKDEAKMLCSSPDGVLGYIGNECKTCPHAKFDEETKKTECNTVKQFLVIKKDLTDVFNVTFAKTGYKAGGEWQNLLKKAGVAPYRRVYSLKSEDSKQYKNVSAITVDTYSGDKRDTPKEYIAFLTELFNQVGEDRKTMIDEFHKMIRARQADGNTPALGHADSEDGVVLLSADTPDVVEESTPSEAKESAAPASRKGSTRYVV